MRDQDSRKFRTIDSLLPHHIQRLHELYQEEWWTRGRTLEETTRGVYGSQVCIGIVDESDRLVGFTRAITDGVFKAFIFDVIVAKACRKWRLGERLMTEVRSHPKIADVRHLELYCLPELVRFYDRFQFSSEVGGVQLMRATNAK